MRGGCVVIVLVLFLKHSQCSTLSRTESENASVQHTNSLLPDHTQKGKRHKNSYFILLI